MSAKMVRTPVRDALEQRYVEARADLAEADARQLTSAREELEHILYQLAYKLSERELRAEVRDAEEAQRETKEQQS